MYHPETGISYTQNLTGTINMQSNTSTATNSAFIKTLRTKPQQNNKPAHADKGKAWERIGDKRAFNE